MARSLVLLRSFIKYLSFIGVLQFCLVPSIFCLEVSRNPNDIRFYLYPSRDNLKFTAELSISISLEFPFTQKSDEETGFKHKHTYGWGVDNGENGVGTGNWNLFKPGQITVFIIHDFAEDGLSNVPQFLKDGYLLQSDIGGNYIVVDWGLLATPQGHSVVTNPKSDYQSVVDNVGIVRNRIESFISYLVSNQLVSHTSLHVIGFGLGAHVGGVVGQAFQKRWGVQLWRITGLDPSRPLFEIDSPARKLNADDAHFVDIIHTGGALQGDPSVTGFVDFYVNGGQSQPGCDDEMTLGLCSHYYAVLMYVAAFSSEIYGCRCAPSSFLEPLLSVCLATCPTPTLLGPYAYLPGAIGPYYVVSTMQPLPVTHYQRNEIGTEEKYIVYYI